MGKSISGKNQFWNIFNWQSTDPRTGFQPTHPPGGSTPSGTTSGTMSGTSVIYSNIIDIAKMDSTGLEITWTGTPTGTIELYGSVSGLYFYTITFSPAFGQPAGSASGELLSLQQYPWKYLMIKYTNASGSGSLIVYGQYKDLN